MRSSSLFALAAASLSLLSFACSAPAAEDDAATGGEANLTERKIVSFTSWVSGGTQSFSQDDASAALAAACAAVGDAEKALAGERFLDAQCGDPQNLVTGAYLFGAKVTSRFVVDVEQGTTPAPAPTTTVFGAQGFSQAEALADLQKNCDAELARAKTLFGDRLLGGGCDTPKNEVSGAYLFSAPFSAFVLPTTGASASIPMTIRAGAQSFSQGDALAAWQAACAAAGTAARVPSDHLVGIDCGTPKNLMTGAYLYGSVGTLAIASGSKDVVPTTGAGANVVGTQSFSDADAFASWQTACTASLALAKEVVGDGFLGGACSAPKNIVTGAYLYASAAPFITMPGGGTHITIKGYAMGTQSFSQGDAFASFTAAEAASIKAMPGGHAGVKVEGFQSDAPKNLVTGAYRFGAHTEVTLGLDVADGALPPQQTTSRVTGQTSFSQDTAAESWGQACADGIAKAKANYGDRYLGGACGEPTYTNQAYTSDLVVWILP